MSEDLKEECMSWNLDFILEAQGRYAANACLCIFSKHTGTQNQYSGNCILLIVHLFSVLSFLVHVRVYLQILTCLLSCNK